MCTLTVCRDVFRGWPLVIAANRDEFFGRPSSTPALIPGKPRIWAPSDGRGGGTWLGLNEHGLFASLTNISQVREIDRDRPSRGVLVTEALRYRSAAEAADRIVAMASGATYNPFQAVCCDAAGTRMVRYIDGPVSTDIADPVLTLSNWDGDPVISAFKGAVVRDAMGSIPTDIPGGRLAGAIGAMLSGHTGADWREHLCVHTDIYGTMSSTIVLLAGNLRDSMFLFADGHPCETGYTDMSTAMKGALGWLPG
jgi:hypothetical protein